MITPENHWFFGVNFTEPSREGAWLLIQVVMPFYFMNNPEYKKNISTEIIQIIGNEYGIKLQHPEQLFLGADKDTFVYKINANDNKKYFLKIRTGEFNELTVLVPYLLLQEIGAHIIAPVKTLRNSLFLKLPEYNVIMYPFIEGKSGKETDLTEEQWVEFGKTLRKIHECSIFRTNQEMSAKTFHMSAKTYPISSKTCQIPKEKFNNKWTIGLKKIMQRLSVIESNNKSVKEFIRMMENRKTIITEMILQAEKLAGKINKCKTEFCLCHGDLHAANIFISENEFYIVDWDTMIIAPKERDLMFIGGGVAGKWNRAEEEKLFYQGYGNHEMIDRTILDYYRFIRIIEDIIVYYEQFFAENAGEKNRRSIIEWVDSIFWPGGVAEMAGKHQLR